MQRIKQIIAIIVTVLCVGGCANHSGLSSAESPQNAVFVDVAQAVGLDFVQSTYRWSVSADPVAMMGSGVCWIDYDNDGWLDLFVVNSYAQHEAGQWQTEEGGLPTSALFKNENGQFSDVSAATQTAIPMRGTGCVAADLNQDGNTDLYITTSRVNLLLWNNGDGTFSEGAVAAGVDGYGWHSAAVVGDLNGDQLPDMFVAGYVNVNRPQASATMGFPNDHEGLQDLLYINLGNDADGRATFREVGAAVGLEAWQPEYGLGALLSDMDGDGDLDLFVANDTNPNRLYRNAPDRTEIGFILIEEGEMAAVNDRLSGMGVAGGDYDADGKIDLFVTNMGYQVHSLYRHSAPMLFGNALDTIGLPDFGVNWTGWGTSWLDVDHDGDLDLFVANGSIPITDLAADGMQTQLYGNLTREGEPGHLADWTAQAGLEAVGTRIGRGSAAADYDNDGDLDMVVSQVGGALTLLENQGTAGNWLLVDLGRFSPGAIVTVTLPDGTTLLRELFAGSSYLSSEDPRLHFGLGSAETVTLTVQYPHGASVTLEAVTVNQILKLDQPD